MIRLLIKPNINIKCKNIGSVGRGLQASAEFPPKLVHQPLWDVHPIYNSCKKHFPTEFSGPWRNIMVLKDFFA